MIPVNSSLDVYLAQQIRISNSPPPVHSNSAVLSGPEFLLVAIAVLGLSCAIQTILCRMVKCCVKKRKNKKIIEDDDVELGYVSSHEKCDSSSATFTMDLKNDKDNDFLAESPPTFDKNSLTLEVEQKYRIPRRIDTRTPPPSYVTFTQAQSAKEPNVSLFLTPKPYNPLPALNQDALKDIV
jgi:hypothetical protein